MLGNERALFVARIQAMQPVVDAACAWRDNTVSSDYDLDQNLMAGVDAYRAGLTPSEVTP
jgi:hypothetical protein